MQTIDMVIIQRLIARPLSLNWSILATLISFVKRKTYPGVHKFHKDPQL